MADRDLPDQATRIEELKREIATLRRVAGELLAATTALTCAITMDEWKRPVVKAAWEEACRQCGALDYVLNVRRTF